MNQSLPQWYFVATLFCVIGICCAGLFLTAPSWFHLLPNLPTRAARISSPTPIPTLTPIPQIPTPTQPPATPTEILLKDIPGVAEYALAMMDQQVIIHDSADRILGLFEDASISEQINTYDIVDEAENIKAAYEELRLLQPPPVLSQIHSGILTASEKCNRSMGFMLEWVEIARAGTGTGVEELRDSAALVTECRADLNEVTSELVRQLEGRSGTESAPTPWPTVKPVPLIPVPTPTPSPTTTLTPSRTPTPWSISTVPAWPVANPTFTPWSPPPTRDNDDDGGGCCKVCGNSQACGDSCIAEGLQCHQPPGCACEG